MANHPAAGRLVLALDLDDLDEARRLAGRCAPWVATVKVGLQLFSSVGPVAVDGLSEDGFDVFVDLKLHDIPATVRRAAAAIARHGARYTTVHAAGGEVMLEAALAGLEEGAPAGGRGTIGLAVTALTSEDADSSLVAGRASLAARCGFGGVVCAVGDLPAVRAAAPGLLTCVPGIRGAGDSADDQRRVGSAESAVLAGADLLVLGRTVTASADPAATLAGIAAAVEQAAATEILVDGGHPR